MSEFKDPEPQVLKLEAPWTSFLRRYPWTGERYHDLAPSFKEHVNHQCSLMVLPILLLCFSLWVPYMEHDAKFHARPWLVYWTRILPTILNGGLLLSYIFSRKFRRSGATVLTIISALLLWFESLTMVSSDFMPVYVSSLYLAQLFPLVKIWPSVA